MLFPYNILAFTEIGLPPTYVYVRRMGIVIMPECCVNASLFLIAELRPANFLDAFWCQKIVSLSTAEKSTCAWPFETSSVVFLVFTERLMGINAAVHWDIGRAWLFAKRGVQNRLFFFFRQPGKSGHVTNIRNSRNYHNGMHNLNSFFHAEIMGLYQKDWDRIYQKT